MRKKTFNYFQAVSVQAEVDGEARTFEFMGKCVPMNPMRAMWIVQGNIFKKEVLAYNEILPTLRKFQKNGMELGVPLCHFGGEEVRFFSLIQGLG